MSFSLSQREEDHEQLVEKSNRFRILDLRETHGRNPMREFRNGFSHAKVAWNVGATFRTLLGSRSQKEHRLNDWTRSLVVFLPVALFGDVGVSFSAVIGSKRSSKAIASRMRGMSPTRRSVGGPAPVVSSSCSISILEKLRLSGIPSPWKCSASYKYKLYTIYIYICTVYITILTGVLSQLVGVSVYNHGYTLNCNPPFSNQPVSPLDVRMRWWWFLCLCHALVWKRTPKLWANIVLTGSWVAFVVFHKGTWYPTILLAMILASLHVDRWSDQHACCFSRGGTLNIIQHGCYWRLEHMVGSYINMNINICTHVHMYILYYCYYCICIYIIISHGWNGHWWSISSFLFFENSVWSRVFFGSDLHSRWTARRLERSYHLWPRIRVARKPGKRCWFCRLKELIQHRKWGIQWGYTWHENI